MSCTVSNISDDGRESVVNTGSSLDSSKDQRLGPGAGRQGTDMYVAANLFYGDEGGDGVYTIACNKYLNANQ